MGLGSFDEGVGLAEARVARDAWRQVLRAGRNPIEDRREREREAARRKTFGEVADELLEARGPAGAIQSIGTSGARPLWRSPPSCAPCPLTRSG